MDLTHLDFIFKSTNCHYTSTVKYFIPHNNSFETLKVSAELAKPIPHFHTFK